MQVDPPAPESLPPELDIDSAPTIAVDLPDGMSFNDFDPAEAAILAAASDVRAEPVVHFDPEVDGALDDDGIPIWEDPT